MLSLTGIVPECFKVRELRLHDTYTVIGLGPRDARFCTINRKNAHNLGGKCAIFASALLGLIRIILLRIRMVKIAH